MGSSTIGSGWNISQQGLNLISQSNIITDKSELLKNALNADLKEIGSPVLSREFNKNQISELVLQIQKIRNVAAPKANEESGAAPRMLKLTLTDGETFVQAIETANIPFISREKTPPGSKVFLKNVKIQNGFLCLNQNNIKLLGGNVPHLCEKWELAKSVQHHSRNAASADGPPAWVNFGFKISNLGDEHKVSDTGKTKDLVKENVEFDNLRKDAIAEATTGAVRKVFGAGAKLVQTTPRIENSKTKYEGGKPQNKFKKDIKSTKEILPPQKPSDKVSLFDYLENKLQLAESSVSVKAKQDDLNERYSQKPNFENRKNNYNSYSYDKNVTPKYHANNSDGKYGAESHVGHGYVSNKKINNSINPNVRKQFPFDRDVESNRRDFDNRDYMKSSNAHRYDQRKKEVASGYETHNSSKRYNYDSSLEKNSNNKQHNDLAEKIPEYVENQVNRKSNSDSSNIQKDNKISRRNNEEKMNDSWHYRAPNSSANQVQSKSVDNVDNLAGNMNKLSIGGEFASRSLRQHLNLQTKRPNVSQNNIETNKITIDCTSFTVGSECLAKYWEDNKFYPARITASTETTYVVQFKGYENIEEVLKSDCMSLDNDRSEKKKYQHRGTLEFRRNSRKFVPS